MYDILIQREREVRVSLGFEALGFKLALVLGSKGALSPPELQLSA
jgi:hypothetical protein